MTVKCIGCGGTLQNTDKEAPFFTPKSLDLADDILCQRCFRMRHYGEILPSVLKESDYMEVISRIASEDILVVKVLDAFDLEGSMMPQIHKLTGANDVLAIVNKRDLLPKSVSDNKLAHRVKRYLKRSGVKAVDVMMVSATKKHGIDAVLDRIAELSQGRNVIIVGATNVGKSTLINAMLQASTELREALITVSNSKGTTQDLIAIPFENQTLYDSPGLFNKNHISVVLGEESFQLIQPKKEVKPKVFQVKHPQSYFMGGLARYDYHPTKQATAVAYRAESLTVHRRKAEESEAFYEKHRGGLLVPPTEKDSLFVLKAHQFHIKRGQKIDIVVPGLCFMSFEGEGMVRVFTPETVIPYQREALI